MARAILEPARFVQITIVTFKGYNEQDRLVAAGILNRMMRRQGRRAFVTTPSDQVSR
jgi:hypothetical protein